MKSIKTILPSLALTTFAGLTLAGPAHAQFSYTYYPGNATVNSDVTTDFAIVGYAGGSYDDDFNPNFTGASSPTVQIVDGANITGEVDSFHSSIVDLTGGSVGGLVPFDNSLVNISGSASVGYAFGFDSSVITVTGGYVADLEGQCASVNVSGGIVDGLIANSQTDFIGHDLGSCLVNVTGGAFNEMDAYNDGILNVHGGTIGVQILAAFGGTVNIYGTGLNTTLVDPNFFFSSGGSTYHYYSLSGTLTDGTTVSNLPLYIRNDSASEGFGTSSLHIFSSAAAPEPNALSLLLLGSIGPVAKRWRRRS